jgi:outer membrane murein-binding lipoprotein Lpp
VSDVLREPGSAISRVRQASRPPMTIVGPHVQDLIPLFALGTLETDERARVTRHCQSCERCADSLTREQQHLASLAFLSPPAVPSPVVKISLFARIAQIQRSASRALVGDRPARPAATLTIPSSREQLAEEARDNQRWSLPRLNRSRSRRSGTSWRSVWPIAMVPLLLLIAGGSYWGLQLRQKIDDRDSQMAELQAQINSMAMTVPADGTDYVMKADPNAPTATGKIAVDKDGTTATVMVQVDQPSASRSYDVYIFKDGRLIRQEPVALNERGYGSASIPLEEPFANYERVEVEARPMATDGTDGSDGSKGSGVLSWEQFASIGEPDEAPSP